MKQVEIRTTLWPTIFCMLKVRLFTLSTGTSGRADFSEHSLSVPPCGLGEYCLMLQQYFSS